jgi:uncharacterized membrane protein (UPF0127 family)
MIQIDSMFHKKKQKRIGIASIALGVLVIAAGAFFFFQNRETPQAGEQENITTQSAAVNDAEKNSMPIVKEHDGITEISLPNPQVVVNKPTLEQLKEFRKRSEDLTRQAKQEREKKIVRIRIGAAEVLPLYTFEDQKKGLIGVEFLPRDSGALYVFQMDDPGRGFGTKGMKFPLDYIWMNSDLTVVHLTKNVPPEYSENIMSIWPARYVLETNAGFIDANGIQVGDTGIFEHIPY